MNNKNYSVKKINDWYILLIYAIVITAFLLSTQTFFSGFHLSDDQILIRFNNNLHQNTFFKTAWLEIYQDLFLRFRPLAILYYLAVAKCLYPNFISIAVLVAMQGILACYFFFRFCRLSQFKMLPSFIFPSFIFFGNQGVIFWRNCVNETLAMFLLSISFYFLAFSLHKRTHKFFYNSLFCIFLVLSTLTKESFIILIPALIFYKVWQQSLTENISIKKSLTKNSMLVIVLILLMLSEIAIIYYYKNTSNRFLDYVSIDEQTFSISHLLTSIIRLWVTKGYLLIIVPAVSYALIIAASNKERLYQFYSILLILFLFITIPQIILYSKSLIFERYLLPGTLGCALLIIYLDAHFKAEFKHSRILRFFLPACILLLSIQTVLMYKGARLYAKEGYFVNNMLSYVKASSPDKTILIVTRPVDKSEQSQSIKLYLESKIGGNHKNVYIEPIVDSNTSKNSMTNFEKTDLLQISNGITYNDIPDKISINQIIFFPKLKEKFTGEHKEINLQLYNSKQFGNFEVLSK